MQPLRRILVPFDFTASSKRACDYALELAAAVGGSLCLAHVVERFGLSLTAAEHEMVAVRAKQELERAVRLVRPHVREVETVVLEGIPAEGIERAVRERSADVVVMGTHGRRGIARALLGSVAARVIRTASVPVVTVPDYVAVSRNAAGTRLAATLARSGLEQPNVVALSRGALKLATALAEQTNGTVDLWAVEDVVTRDGEVLGAVGEDESIVLDDASGVADAVRDEAIASARARLRAELSALKGARTIGECWRRDVVVVADGLFSAAYARVAVDALAKLGPSKMVMASPVVARDVAARLEGRVGGVVWLDRATVSEDCTYRDDAVPSDAVGYELLLAARAPRASA
jgi:nucleotide-binding universal stress UspA family protein/predicted phosphoribosyltransferase